MAPNPQAPDAQAPDAQAPGTRHDPTATRPGAAKAATAFERRVLEALDQALLWPEAEADARLRDLEQADPALGRRVRSLLGNDHLAQQALPTQPPAPLLHGSPVPPDRIGPYRLTEALGEGGMGVVWRGERDDGVFDQVVAVKLMRPSLFSGLALAQFNTERQVLARLQHPNISQLFDGGADPDGRAYFVMEYVRGQSFTAYANARRLSLRGCAELLLPVCAAVQYAHQALVVHADIKPSNILVDAEGRPKLLDFGIARNLLDADGAAAGQGLTPAYASPQRRDGHGPTPADDVYALGALLYEIAAHVPPDAAPPPPLGPGVPADYAAIVVKATAADPLARYDGAGALADDLRRFTGHYPVRARPSSVPRAAWYLALRRPMTVAGTVAAVTGLVAALVVISTLLVRSEAERRETDRQFQHARSMARYMLFDLFDRLNDVPGSLPVRQALADKARTYLRDLATAPRAPLDVLAESAIGYMQLAGVEGLFTAGALGERQRAQDTLRQAERLLAVPVEPGWQTPMWRYAQGRLQLFQGFRAFDQGGGARAAIPLLTSAVAQLRQAARTLPDQAEPAADLWQAQLTLADTLGAGQDHAGEIAAVRQALDDYAARKALLDSHEKTPLLLARSQKLIGDAQYYQGARAAAVDSYRQAEAILSAEDERHPRRTRTLMELMDARWNLASSLADGGDTDRALALYDQALAAGRARLLVEPDHDGLQRMTSLLTLERAGLLAQLGRMGEAVLAAQDDLAIRQRLAGSRPDDLVVQRNYLAALRPVGDIAQAAGQRAEACALYRQASDGYAAFRRHFALSERVVASELADIEQKLRSCPVQEPR